MRLPRSHLLRARPPACEVVPLHSVEHGAWSHTAFSSMKARFISGRAQLQRTSERAVLIVGELAEPRDALGRAMRDAVGDARGARRRALRLDGAHVGEQ